MQRRTGIRFLLNDGWVALENADPTLTLLDFLRLERRLTGTKEGCAEGDCGACTVLVGRLRHGALRYQALNACIAFAPSLEGCHIVTVEHLKGEGGALHPVQQALVELHGSQCGFCTPGIVMSLYALWLTHDAPPPRGEIEEALAGNLCRCTGYGPILAALARAYEIAAPARDVLRVRGDAQQREEQQEQAGEIFETRKHGEEGNETPRLLLTGNPVTSAVKKDFTPAAGARASPAHRQGAAACGHSGRRARRKSGSTQ